MATNVRVQEAVWVDGHKVPFVPGQLWYNKGTKVLQKIGKDGLPYVYSKWTQGQPLPAGTKTLGQDQ